LKSEGHEIVSFDFDLLDYIVPTYYVLTAAEASSNLSRYDGIRYGHRSNKEVADLNNFYTKNRTEGFGKEVKRRIMLGNFVLSSGYYDAYYQKAQQVRKLLQYKTTEIFKTCDAIMMPTSPTTAFNIGEKKKDLIAMYLADIFTVLSNLTGIPSIALPLYKHSNELPFGLQILTNQKDELALLQLSNILMRSSNTVS
jgi:aspartyl-tRNA(Asn)/glutamyl-tRNA(Gln) amidotransferase subunit A